MTSVHTSIRQPKLGGFLLAGAAMLVVVVACGSSGSTATITPSPSLEATAAPSTTPSVEPTTVRRAAGFVPLDNPTVIEAAAATYLTPEDRVLGVTVNGESRAYPIRMMTYHHVANDEIGGEPVLITF